MKFISRSTLLYRELKKATEYVKGVMVENKRLREENDAMMKTITSLQVFSRPVEVFQRDLYFERDDHVVLEPYQPERQLQLFGGSTENGGGGGDVSRREKIKGLNRDNAEMHNNEIGKIDVGSGDEFLCDALLSLSAHTGGGGADTPLAAAALVSFRL